VNAAVGDEERAGDAVGRHVRQRRGQRAEQSGAIGFAVGPAGFDDAHLKALDLLQAIDQRLSRLLGFLRARADILARALVHHHGRDRGQRFALLVVNEGFASANTISASAATRISAPRERPMSSSAAITATAASAIHRTRTGTSGAKAIP